MSGIFNIFGDDAFDTGGSVHAGELKGFQGARGVTNRPLKSLDQRSSKPKGLSIRPHNSNALEKVNATISKKNNVLVVPKLTQQDTCGRPISPSKKEAKAQGVKSICTKELSPGLRMKKKIFEDFIFKRPKTPKEKNMNWEPEQLPTYFDENAMLDNFYNLGWEREVLELASAMNRKIIPYTDETEETSPADLKAPTIFLETSAFDPEILGDSDVDSDISLPEISDED